MNSLTESLTSCCGDNTSKSSGFIFSSLRFSPLPLEPAADCGGACCGSGLVLQAIDLNYTVCRLQNPERVRGREREAEG